MTCIISPVNGIGINPNLIEWDDVRILFLHGGLDIPERLTPFSLWAVMKHDAQIEIMTGQEVVPIRQAGNRLAAEHGVELDDWSLPVSCRNGPVSFIVETAKIAIAEDNEAPGRKGGVADHSFLAGEKETAFLITLAKAAIEATAILTAKGVDTMEAATVVMDVMEKERDRFRALCDAAGRVRDMTP